MRPGRAMWRAPRDSQIATGEVTHMWPFKVCIDMHGQSTPGCGSVGGTSCISIARINGSGPQQKSHSRLLAISKCCPKAVRSEAHL